MVWMSMKILVVFGAMKQQQSIVQKRFSSGSVQKDTGESIPTISQLIAKSFIRNTYSKLIFTSQSLSMIKPIALSYLEEFPLAHQPANLQLLLIDFSELEIDFLQETLRRAALQKACKNHFEPDVEGALYIIKMNNQPIEKRKVLYMKAGILSLSSQIFLTDLLRGWSEGSGLKLKIVLKLSDKVLSYYHYHAWLTTILKIKEAQGEKDKEGNLSLIYLCNRPNHYADENELIRIYRTFFCKKVIIWPFGRAEIHKILVPYRQHSNVKEWQHTLSMSEGERKLHQTLMELYYFLKKRLGTKFTHKPGGEHILYSSLVQDGYQFAKGEFTEFQNVKLLLVHQQSCSKLTILNQLSKFIQMKDCEIWNSNNSEAITIIENLYNQLEESVFHYEKKEETSNVELIPLFNKADSVEIEINYEKERQYTCLYPICLTLTSKPQTNEKIVEVIKIIESIQPKQQHGQQVIDEQVDEATKKFQYEISKKNCRQQQQHNVLIICGLKSVERFIQESLEGYMTDKSYLQYLQKLYRYLKFNRNFRLRKIKKIYERRKIKKADNLIEGSKKIGDRHVWMEQNKQILKEIFYHQLQKLHTIMSNFQNSIGVLNNQIGKGMNSQDTFQHNMNEAKIIESFNEDIINAGFTIIDISRIKAHYITTNIRNFVFETNNLKKRVFVDHEHKSDEPNYFYQLLAVCNPSTIIFYSPSPLLVRSLYLFQIQNSTQNLKQIHIFSYENSYQTKKAVFEVTKEDKAFWNLSQNRSKLPQFMQSPFLRVKNINFRDSLEQAKYRLHSKSLFNSEEGVGEKSIGQILNVDEMRRKVLVDTREFKSSLPSYLYHFGFEVIPVFLKTSDYVLSDDTAIQKKSVHTRDLHNSIKSLRLQQQLKRMLKFKHPYLLIECQEQSDFTKSNFGYIDGTSGNKCRYQLRKKIMQLMHKFPTVRLIWSTSVDQSCQFIRQLKEEKQDPDLSKFIKDQNEQYQEEKIANLPRITQTSSKKQEDD